MDSAAGQLFPYITSHVYAVKAEDLSLTFATRFNVLHAEKLPSAIERYSNEVKRILGVLENCLARKQ